MMGKERVQQRSLSKLREEIDATDRELFYLIAQRMPIVREIGALRQA
ncbi:MAG: chorismate mutase, partial [Candidatus Marinimicrobia bacterium]|nr:chorismate mutase [Candidatus Neomarinimicrobiota bacterium]